MPGRAPLTEDLIQAFHLVFRKMKREIREVLGEDRGTVDFIFLRRLAGHGPCKVSDLSAELDVTNSHVTQQSDRLVNKGWVSRRRSEADKRVVELTITPRGETVYAEMEERRRRYFRETFHSFTDEELEILLRLFHKLLG